MAIYNHHKGPFLNSSIKALLLVSGLFMFIFNMLSPIYAIFVEKIGGNLLTAANSSAIFLAVSGLLTFFASRYVNKMKEKELAIMWSQIVLGIGYLMYYFTHNVFMLFMVQIVLGIGEAFYWPAFHAVFASHTDEHQSVSQWGVYDGLTYLIPAGGAALGGYLVTLFGFDFIFISMALLSFANGIFIFFLPRKLL
jgi:predicted MFS family arabinose efflux permease